MSRLMDILATGVTDRLPVGEERELIDLAQGQDEGATVALLGIYATMIRSRTRGYRDQEEARQIAVLSFLEAVREFDPQRHEGGLGGLLKVRLRLDLETESRPVLVSRRSWQRYLHIMRVVDQDVERALIVAPEYLMSQDTFWQIYLAAQGAIGEYPVLTAPDEYHDVEDQVLAEQAMATLDDLEGQVVRLIYGFDDEPKSLSEVVYTLTAEKLGEAAAEDGQKIFSRMTISRVHARALTKMRAAVGTDGAGPERDGGRTLGGKPITMNDERIRR